MDDNTILASVADQPDEHHAAKHLLGAGVLPASLTAGRRLGLPFAKILKLLIQYGPKVIAIIEAIAEALKDVQPPTPAEGVPVKAD